MTYQENARLWLAESFDEETRKHVQDLLDTNSPDLEDAFYRNLEFGTGGMRGIMGVGTNRLNRYTLGQATQGLANYLLKCFPGEDIRVAIAYDVRNNSKEFGKMVADVLTANGIHVLLFKNHRPTPELSFTVREKKCHAGIVLTASHNPPQYNGYKVYWSDGAQIVPPQDEEIIKEVFATSFDQIKFNGNDALLTYLDEQQDDVYIDACIQNSLYQKDKPGYQDLKIVFTPIHGTTYTTVPKALAKAGFTKVDFVEEQMIPSGNFPTVDSPNPEEPAALQMALDVAERAQADIVIGTDPDGDRLGIAVRDDQGEMFLLNGNQCNTILTHYILEQWKQQGKLQGKEFIGSTIVTSDIFFKLAELYDVECMAGLTGFKWIGKMIRDHEGDKKFICGGEDSFGFMTGDFVRDKDSCGSILLACEIAAWLKNQGKTMYQYLAEIYTKTGVYDEGLINLTKKGREGAEEIIAMMKNFRENPPQSIADSPVVRVRDIQTLTEYNLSAGTNLKITELPASNVLIFYTEDGTKVCVRPSGTEPKIKFYVSVQAPLENAGDFAMVKKDLEQKIILVKDSLGL